jgi:hypothetical protein
MLTDFKKTLLELRINGTVNDPIMKCAGYLFQIRIGDDLVIAEWHERKEAGKAGKIMKKIRFPLKFEYLNSTVGRSNLNAIDHT